MLADQLLTAHGTDWGSKMEEEALLSLADQPSSQSLGRVGTLGMFIIDQFQVYDDAGSPVILDEEVMGGGGVYAMTAARMFLPASSCALIVDKGEDFPKAFEERLRSMGEEMFWFRDCKGNSTRALNIYSGKEVGEAHQSFKYLARQAQISPKDFVSLSSPFGHSLPEYLHVVCLVDRAMAITDELDTLQQAGLDLVWSPKVVWEPLPGSCTSIQLNSVVSVASHFAVFSPNTLELQSLLGLPVDNSPRAIEQAARAFKELIGETTIIIRAGHLGSYTLSRSWTGWTPAYWTKDQPHRVVDPTGGGNAFLGGLCAGLLVSRGDMRMGSIYGSAAASFAIQQRGIPVLRDSLWNGDQPSERLRQIASRMR